MVFPGEWLFSGYVSCPRQFPSIHGGMFKAQSCAGIPCCLCAPDFNCWVVSRWQWFMATLSCPINLIFFLPPLLLNSLGLYEGPCECPSYGWALIYLFSAPLPDISQYIVTLSKKELLCPRLMVALVCGYKYKNLEKKLAICPFKGPQ